MLNFYWSSVIINLDVTVTEENSKLAYSAVLGIDSQYVWFLGL